MRMPYIMAHDCPECGCKDGIDEWGGARMSCSSWEHDFMCCSDECGKAFARKHKIMSETKIGRKQLRALWNKLSEQSGSLLCGEPYYGYDAEQLLKSLGRR